LILAKESPGALLRTALDSVELMNYQNLLVARDGDAALVTLNRPQRRNALSLELMEELTRCLGEIEESPEIRAVILAAAGPVFSSGHDLSEMTGRSENECEHLFNVCSRLMMKIQSIPQPVIAEVQGMATAAGCQLVASCDLAVASDSATFATPGVRIGLFCTTPMVALTRAIGRKRAMEMLLTGEAISAQTAAEWGLINQVVPAAGLIAATRKLAARIAEASALIVATGKRGFYKQIDLDQPGAYHCAGEIMTGNALTDDAQEGIQAFLQKRVPRWTGK
jgi:enoyl-CoA hydratase/carnithine racemase